MEEAAVEINLSDDLRQRNLCCVGCKASGMLSSLEVAVSCPLEIKTWPEIANLIVSIPPPLAG